MTEPDKDQRKIELHDLLQRIDNCTQEDFVELCDIMNGCERILTAFRESGKTFDEIIQQLKEQDRTIISTESIKEAIDGIQEEFGYPASKLYVNQHTYDALKCQATEQPYNNLNSVMTHYMGVQIFVDNELEDGEVHTK